MSMVEDLAKGAAPSALIGIGVVLAAPILLPIVGTVVRPLAKEAIKGYLAASRKVREMAAETSEQFSDLVAEARAEHVATLAAAGGGTRVTVDQESAAQRERASEETTSKETEEEEEETNS